MQANIKGREAKSLDKQIQIHIKQLEINEKEATIHKMETKHASETEQWYRPKYTNEKLYSWMESSIRSMHYDL